MQSCQKKTKQKSFLVSFSAKKLTTILIVESNSAMTRLKFCQSLWQLGSKALGLYESDGIILEPRITAVSQLFHLFCKTGDF